MRPRAAGTCGQVGDWCPAHTVPAPVAEQPQQQRRGGGACIQSNPAPVRPRADCSAAVCVHRPEGAPANGAGLTGGDATGKTRQHGADVPGACRGVHYSPPLRDEGAAQVRGNATSPRPTAAGAARVDAGAGKAFAEVPVVGGLVAAAGHDPGS